METPESARERELVDFQVQRARQAAHYTNPDEGLREVIRAYDIVAERHLLFPVELAEILSIYYDVYNRWELSNVEGASKDRDIRRGYETLKSLYGDALERGSPNLGHIKSLLEGLESRRDAVKESVPFPVAIERERYPTDETTARLRAELEKQEYLEPLRKIRKEQVNALRRRTGPLEPS